MISQYVQAWARRERWTDPRTGAVILPINVCAMCGDSDDPESRWSEDEDGDRHCPRCILFVEAQMKKESTAHVVRKLHTDGRIEYGDWNMTLEEMRRFVGGVVQVCQAKEPRRAVIVNDYGFVDDLPQNPNATALLKPGTDVIDHVRGPALYVVA